MLAFLEPRVLLQAFYLLASVALLFVYLTPVLNKRFLAYGARDAAEPPRGKQDSSTNLESQTKAAGMNLLLDRIANLKVPHRWFIHFYVVSVLSSALWAHQIITQGQLYCFVASFAPASDDPNPCIRVVGCWALLAIQGMRRLYECLRQPQGSSTMWVGHYVMGIAFYLATSIAIWIEGLPALKAFHALGNDCNVTYKASKEPVAVSDLIANAVIFGCFMDQHVLHTHLASLKKYTLPTHPTFQWIVAPHYTCECLIYLALAFLSRPSGYYLNHTMAAALVFVVINLGISADGTKKWMQTKFGNGSVAKKWRMLPGIW